MKKSVQVTLTAVAAFGLAACRRHGQDPCESASFSQQACEDAVANGGYYWNGSWMPMTYHYPYPYYFDSYQKYVGSGHTVNPAPGQRYGRPAMASPAGDPASPGVVRGGFGSTGAGHGAGE
jgi:hypothetical protein